VVGAMTVEASSGRSSVGKGVVILPKKIRYESQLEVRPGVKVNFGGRKSGDEVDM
jgi:hypothetical protein